MRFLNRLFIPAVVGLAFLTLAVGCSRSRGVSRSKVLEAENINQRQKLATLNDQVMEGHRATDSASAREQQLRAELVAARTEAGDARSAHAQAAEARGRLVGLQGDLRRSEAELADAVSKYDALQRARALQAAPVRVATNNRTTQVRPGGISPEAEAMRRDLRQQLASYGIRDLKVEVRRERNGEERVAIVLPDAFPAGKATLAYNASAVKAVISVGKLIRSHYKNSRVVVEGHTDSDPIRHSSWGTNENLSRARAKAVESLLTNSGVPSGSVRTDGLGATHPLAMGKTKRAKSRNRRVEIFITPRS